MAAGIKTDALADQRDGLARAPWTVTQMHDRGIIVRAALRYRTESAGTHFPESLEIVFLVRPAVLSGELSDALAIARGRQFVGRQHRQLAAQQIAFSTRAQCGIPVRVAMTVHVYRRERPVLRFFLALRQERAVYPGAIDRDFGCTLPMRGATRHHNRD